MLSWTVGPPSNEVDGKLGQGFSVQIHSGVKKDPGLFPIALFTMREDEFNSMQINYGDLPLLHLNYTGDWDSR